MLGFVHQTLVVGVDEDQAVLARQPAVEFGLGHDDALEAAEAFEVGAAHIGDESAVGVGDAAEELDFAQMVGAHLDDGNLGIGGDGQQGQRHAEVVVEVALGGRHAVALGENGGDQFLGGGLAVGAGDADDGDGEVAAVLAGKFLQGAQHVGDDDATVVDLVLRIADDAQGGALLEGLRSKGVAIEMLALEGKEDASGGDGARVGGDSARYQICLVKSFYHV